ncbi:hypothetical protein BD289DRAFT_443886, partial [Coniella lustricola]
ASLRRQLFHHSEVSYSAQQLHQQFRLSVHLPLGLEPHHVDPPSTLQPRASKFSRVVRILSRWTTDYLAAI